MIAGVRSAIICDRVEHDAHGCLNYFGVAGETLLAVSKPGFVGVCLALTIGQTIRFPSAS